MWFFPSHNEDRVPVKAGQCERFGALCFGWDAEDVSGLWCVHMFTAIWVIEGRVDPV